MDAQAEGLQVVFAEVREWEQEYLAAQPEVQGWRATYHAGAAETLEDEVLSEAEVLSCFIHSAVDQEVLARCPLLRLVATRSTGFDHIDLQACAQRDIAVCNVPQYGENTVAEHTFGLILALSRHIHEAVERVRRGNLSIEGLLGTDLYGKTLGVVGAGSIGLHVIRIGRALNMRVLAYDVRREPVLAEVLGFTYASLEEVLAEADVVSLHVPLNEATRHLLNAERLALMKPSALLVNTSRGGVVDSQALLVQLNKGHLAGAALDVLEGEEVISEDWMLAEGDSPEVLARLRLAVEAYQLMHHPRVIVTPHIGFYSHEALQRILRTTAENIAAYEAGVPRNLVGSARGR